MDTVDFKVNETATTSLNNFIKEFDMICAKPFMIGLFMSLFFLGYVVNCFYTAYLSERIGRKTILIVNLIIMIGCFTTMSFTRDLALQYGIFFIFGVTTGSNVMTMLVYVRESTTDKFYAEFITI